MYWFVAVEDELWVVSPASGFQEISNEMEKRAGEYKRQTWWLWNIQLRFGESWWLLACLHFTDKPTRPDPIISILGSDLGPWQLIVCLWIFLSKFPTGWVQISMVFLQSPINYSCLDPDNSTDVCSANCKTKFYKHINFKENIITEWNLTCDRQWLSSLAQSFVMIGIMLGNIIFGLLADKWVHIYI